MAIDFTIVTAVTPDYLDRLVWALPTWSYKPQFANKPIVIFHSGFECDDTKKLRFVKDIFPDWTFVTWRMPEYESQRELMLSAFVLGIEQFVKTQYFVKMDAETFFTNKEDVFIEDDLKYDLVSHKWGYTKPGWWIDKLEGKSVDLNNLRMDHDRIISFCCLHKTDFVVKVAQKYGARLPIPSHDTLLWWEANKSGTWLAKNLKKLGVDNCSKWRGIREAVCISEARDNDYYNRILEAKVQLEITTDCNLKCFNCDRACGIAPSAEHMELEQIWKFVEESLQAKKRWFRIDILGGEPTLYPDLSQLWFFLKLYKDKYPRCIIRFSTNGLKKIKVPKWVRVRNSIKQDRLQDDHVAVNSAPCDNGETGIKCCSVPWRCGLALTKHGYFLCGAGASIARVFGLDVGIKNLRDVNSAVILEQINQLCKYCGHSMVKSKHIPVEQETSTSWQKAIETYKDKKLSEY
jgi:hypothetical protein